MKKLSNAYPWVVIFFCAAFLFYKYILQVSPSVMTHDLMRTFNVDGEGLGNLAATYFYAYLLTQLFVGPLLDLHSPKYLTVLAIGVSAAGALLFTKATTLPAAMFARAMMGFGTAFATVSYMKMSSLWFRSHQVAFVDGLLATAAMAGALCGQVPLRLLVNHGGWQEGLRVCGYFGLVLMVLFFLFVREKKTEQAVGYRSRDVIRGLWVLLKSKKNWMLTFYSGLAFTPVAVLGGLWGNPFFQEAYHLSATQAASFTSFMFVGLAVGGPFFGFLTRFYPDKLKVMMFGTTLGCLGLMASLYLNDLSLVMLGVALFIFGFGIGSFMSCYSFGKEMNSLAYAASVVALINTGDALFGSFTEPLIGKILDLGWQGSVVRGVHYFSVHDYHVALSLLPLYSLGALFCLWRLKKTALSS
jgi:MFS family permease